MSRRRSTTLSRKPLQFCHCRLYVPQTGIEAQRRVPAHVSVLIQPLSRNSHTSGEIRTSSCRPRSHNVSVGFLLAFERQGYKRIYAEVAGSARHWVSKEATSNGVRINNDRSHDACNSRALSSLPPVFAASV